jgi:hypothetical protein
MLRGKASCDAPEPSAWHTSSFDKGRGINVSSSATTKTVTEGIIDSVRAPLQFESSRIIQREIIYSSDHHPWPCVLCLHFDAQHAMKKMGNALYYLFV